MPSANRANRRVEFWPRERLLRDLNDRLGGPLCQAAVFLERDDREVDVLKAEGELRLRSRENVSSREHLPREDDLSGIYTVGKVMLDLSDAPPHLEVSDLPTVGLLEVKLGEGVWLRIVPIQFAGWRAGEAPVFDVARFVRTEDDGRAELREALARIEAELVDIKSRLPAPPDPSPG